MMQPLSRWYLIVSSNTDNLSMKPPIVAMVPMEVMIQWLVPTMVVLLRH